MVFALVGELIGNLNLQKQRCRIKPGARLLVLSRLLQIGAVARTIERHLALLAATLRADASVDGGTEAFLLANFTNGATQMAGSPLALWHQSRNWCRGVRLDVYRHGLLRKPCLGYSGMCTRK